MKAGTCVHFTGIQARECKVGVNYRNHVGGSDLGWGLRMPCIAERAKDIATFTPEQKSELAKRVPCTKYQEPTADQIAEVKDMDQQKEQGNVST